ncbi:MAG TPA: hypothetical protein VHX39_06230, partial [Acetobacteraceae bacterium]|nr:hypothetical protein [Acetobacteraceae bacterium]
MDEGISLAVSLVLRAPAEADRDVVMVTDGMPDPNRRENTLVAAVEARNKKVSLSSLGVGSENVDLNFLSQLSPMSLVIDRVDGLGDAMTTLLTKSASARAGGLLG